MLLKNQNGQLAAMLIFCKNILHITYFHQHLLGVLLALERYAIY